MHQQIDELFLVAGKAIDVELLTDDGILGFLLFVLVESPSSALRLPSLSHASCDRPAAQALSSDVSRRMNRLTLVYALPSKSNYAPIGKRVNFMHCSHILENRTLNKDKTPNGWMRPRGVVMLPFPDPAIPSACDRQHPSIQSGHSRFARALQLLP